MECKHDVYEKYNNSLDEQHSKMVWTHHKVKSWYRNSSEELLQIRHGD